MYEQVEKPKENKSRAVANSAAQKKSDDRQSFGFLDNRPKVFPKRKSNASIANVQGRLNTITGKKPDLRIRTPIQLQPVAEGHLGKDDEFLNLALKFSISPKKYIVSNDKEGNNLYMIDFASSFGCQIHIHEATDGEIKGAHLKNSKNGNLYHPMDNVDAILYLDGLKEMSIPLEDRRNKSEHPLSFSRWKEFRGYYHDDMDDVLMEEYKEYLNFQGL